MKRIMENKNDVFLCKVKSFIDSVEENENFDEYTEMYDETEIQNDIPSEPEVEEYFDNNYKDLCYYTFIRQYKNWISEIKQYCELFKQMYNVYPNVLIANRNTFGRFEDAFEDYYCDPDSEDFFKKRVEVGLEYDSEIINPESKEIGECFFHGDGYKLRMMENSSFGSGVIKFSRVHGSLSYPQEFEYGTVSKANKSDNIHPVIDMEATGKNIEKIMKEEGVSPKIFARIMGWERPQAVYRWYYGETLPSVDTLSVLSKILNRPIEALLVMRERN